MSQLTGPHLALMSSMINQIQQTQPNPTMQRFTNPWTTFGAALMAGSDPRRQGLGGLGSAILQTGQSMRDQEVMAAEQQMRQLQMSMMLAQAQREEAVRAERLRQQALRQQQIDDFVASLPEDQRAAARQNPQAFSQALATAQYREPKEPKISNARRIYKEMGGRQGTGKSYPEWYETDYKSGGTTVNIGGMKEPIRKRTLQYGAMEDALQRLDDLVERYGTETLPTEAKSRMSTAYKNAVLQAKNLFELGALAGPDLQLIEETLSDPTALKGAVVPSGHYRAQIDEVRRILTSARRRLAETLPEGDQRSLVNPRGSGWTETGSGARWRVKQ